jgi:hypothetical protein
LTPTSKAAQRVFEFFTTQINNGHTHGQQQLTSVLPYHVVAFVNDLQGAFSPPMEKQHLAAAGAISKAACAPGYVYSGCLIPVTFRFETVGR